MPQDYATNADVPCAGAYGLLTARRKDLHIFGLASAARSASDAGYAIQHQLLQLVQTMVVGSKSEIWSAQRNKAVGRPCFSLSASYGISCVRAQPAPAALSDGSTSGYLRGSGRSSPSSLPSR